MLDASRLSRRFGSVVVLDDVSFQVAPGECLVLLGHNGAGKTTALRLVAGRLDPTEGSVTIDGASPHVPTTAGAARAALSFVPDSPLLYDRLTVAEHVALVHAAHVPRASDQAAEAPRPARFAPSEAMAELEIEDLADRLPDTLSRGQRQRVQLACAVARPLDLLILDEPIVGLDPRSQTILLRLLQRLRSDGAAVLLSTHQVGFARAVGDRAVVLEGGRLVFTGSVDGAAEVCTDLVPW